MLVRFLSPILTFVALIVSLSPCSSITALFTSHTPTTAVATMRDQPSAEVVALADAATMTDRAKAFFYGAQPVIDDDRAVFEQHCHAPVSSNTIELGCYRSDNRIFLLRIDDPQLEGEMAVAAAHEMLHAAYARLSPTDRATVNTQLEAAVIHLHSADLTRSLRMYRTLEPGQRDNELHSTLGTEYVPLGPGLEQYYRQYLSNRAVVVADARQFDKALLQIEKKGLAR